MASSHVLKYQSTQGQHSTTSNQSMAAMDQQQHEVVIVGAGIAGLTTALMLKRVGIASLVLERSDELRATGAALSLFPNAWRALDALGVAHKLIPLYRPFQTGNGFTTNVDTGATQMMSFNTMKNSDGMGLLTVHRKTLLEALADELPVGTIRFSSKLAAMNADRAGAVLHLEDGSVIAAKILIGCDGVHSKVAQWLGLAPPVESGRSAVRGLAVFPDGHDFKNQTYQYLGVGKRAGVVPINDTDLYWFIVTISTPEDKKMAGDPGLMQREVTENLAKGFPAEFLKVVSNSDLSTITWSPLLYRRPSDVVFGQTHTDNVVVIGDAMHPMTPDLGQGGCSALNDAIVLGRSIGAGPTGREGIVRFMGDRRWRTAGLIAGAYMTGWVQQGWPGLLGWTVRWFRDNVFYRFVFPSMIEAANYDCGVLPIVE